MNQIRNFLIIPEVRGLEDDATIYSMPKTKLQTEDIY